MLGMGGKKNKDGRDLDDVPSLLSASSDLTFSHVTRNAVKSSSTFPSQHFADHI